MRHVFNSSGLDKRERWRSARQGLEGGDQLNSRLLFPGKPGTLAAAHALDNCNPRLGGGNICLCGLDPGCNGCNPAARGLGGNALA
jgi:hypothetical protein